MSQEQRSLSKKRTASPSYTQSSSKKRALSPSYAQNYRDGEVPKAYSPAYEMVLAENGMFMEEWTGQSRVGQESKSLCTQALRAIHPESQYTAFSLQHFLLVWQRAQNRNEARVYRDITPLLVPSPELLWICGHQELEHVAEDISVQWTRCKTLGGPQPKPDVAIGIASSAFSEEETTKLKNHTAFERATLFTNNIYFPFLLCEVKCGNEGINRADRQNMHSSSMAVNAIIQLYRALGENKVADLSGQILVFSISHDNERVKLYGHFAVIEGEKTSFYRYLIARFWLDFEENQGRQRTSNFVREIYRTFYPAHLKRIRDALAAMENPQTLSMTSSMSIEESEAQEEDPSARSSQEAALLRQIAEQQRQSEEQMALLQEQQAEQQRQSEKQMAEQQRQSEKQMAEQQRQSKEQMAFLKKQMAEQQKQMAEQMILLKQLLERQ